MSQPQPSTLGTSQDQITSIHAAGPENADQEGAQAGLLQRMKSQLTVMLAGNPQTQRIHEIFAAIPRRANTQAEVPPIMTLKTSSGMDFALKVFLTVVQGTIMSYLFMVGIGFIYALINMVAGSCGQKTWHTSASEACEKMVLNSLAISFETRCLSEKPQAMLQEDFDQVCGEKVVEIIFLVLAIVFVIFQSYKLIQELPVKTNFYADFFTVESWSGEKFQCSFYADVTHATASVFGLKIITKAKAKLNAGGADDDKNKKGKTLQVEGSSTIVVLAGSGEQKQKFLSAFAEYLPIHIDGFDGVAKVSASTSTLLEGRMQEILDMRTAETGSCKAVRMPLTCDIWTEVAFAICCFLIFWYLCSTVPSFISWAITKGTDKCKDPMKPEEDMCAAWRIFSPFELPLVHAEDYINLVLLILGLLAVIVWIAISKAVEYRLHKNGGMQEVLLAGWEWQDNKIFFPEDVESLETCISSMEKCVKMQAKAFYIISNGIKEPFSIKACFRPETYKFMLADPDCASCCGQRQDAVGHSETLQSLVNEFAPDKYKTIDQDSKQS